MLVLAACGSSSSSGTGASSTTQAPSSSAGPSTTAGNATGATVSTAMNAKNGSILVDSAGRTLYTLTNNGKAVACSASCLNFWPPLLLASGTTQATPGSGVTGLGTVSAAGGTQVTANGLPLYHFSGDTSAGQANGEGISSFGGTWHVVKASSSGATAPAGAAPTTVAASPTTTGAYGY
jgi:predicted lipoprotein with Yx(FWY)xxD motif